VDSARKSYRDVTSVTMPSGVKGEVAARYRQRLALLVSQAAEAVEVALRQQLLVKDKYVDAVVFYTTLLGDVHRIRAELVDVEPAFRQEHFHKVCVRRVVGM
jgi:hypothetical protein